MWFLCRNVPIAPVLIYPSRACSYPCLHSFATMRRMYRFSKQNVAFGKRESYAYQNEFRFVVSAENIDVDHLELDIGNIKDISIIMKASSILNAEVFRRN